MSRALVVAALALLWACPDVTTPGRPADVGPRDAAAADARGADDAAAIARDAEVIDDARPGEDASALADAAEPAGDAAAPDAAVACARPVGERFPAGDGCNFCECQAGGATRCTQRVCQDSVGGCTYAGVAHAYGERFASADGCNACVCAASGLACTTRSGCADVPESAILLESPDAPCGAHAEFTPARVLGTLPVTDFTAPFLYERTRPPNLYPESLPDTQVRVRIVFDGGFMVCRIPSPDQPALDLQVTVEWITADGALDEGFAAYLRRNDFGFLDAWLVGASLPLGGLSGSYVPNCALDPGGYAFDVQVEPSGRATGAMRRVCETDLPLVVGAFERPPP